MTSALVEDDKVLQKCSETLDVQEKRLALGDRGLLVLSDDDVL